MNYHNKDDKFNNKNGISNPPKWNDDDEQTFLRNCGGVFAHEEKIREAMPKFTSASLYTSNALHSNHESLKQKFDQPFELKSVKNYYYTVKPETKSKLYFNNIPPMPTVMDKWIVPNVSSPPVGYQMTRTSFSIPLIDDGTTLQSIADTVFNSNKNRSIHTEYKNNEAKCKTTSFMKFNIQLHRGCDANSIVMEVRRTGGCCLEFRNEYQTLVQLFKGDSSSSSTMPQKRKRMMNKLNRKCLLLPPIPHGVIENNLETSLRQLSSESYDTRLFALEDLIVSTNPDKCKDVAKQSCELILGNYDDILNLLLTIICSIDKDKIDNESWERTHCAALTLLKNISIQSSSSSISDEQQSSFLTTICNYQDTLLPSLLRDVKMAPMYPWNAALACQCLSSICAQIGTTEMETIAADLVHCVKDTLAEAECVGKQCHLSLEVEAKKASRLFSSF